MFQMKSWNWVIRFEPNSIDKFKETVGCKLRLKIDVNMESLMNLYADNFIPLRTKHPNLF